MRLATIALALVVPASSAMAHEYLVTCGPLEVQMSDRGVEAVVCRDRFVFGDAFSNPRPAIDLHLLTDKWQRLARVAESQLEPCQMLEQSPERAKFKASGVMAQAAGPGQWR
ncbi:MAG: hypothetical protein FJ272_20580, partial [Planctomycetes bacterium]|nr:hypothetical protein [Planctomycetota bacterium]